MTLRKDLISATLATLVLTLLLGILYPLLVTGVSQGVFPGNANGQLIRRGGRIIGSALIGQSFADPVLRLGRPVLDAGGTPVTDADPRFFQTRPSATVPPDSAAASTFSNLGPNSVATEREIAANIGAYIALNGRYVPGGLSAATTPVDAADSSASGIDPDISVRNADIQARRVAAVDRLSLRRVDRLVATYTGGRGLGFSGEPGVNVLQLNLAIDRLIGGR